MIRLCLAIAIVGWIYAATCFGAAPSTAPTPAIRLQIEQYRKALKLRGEPATAADLVRPAVDEKDNAVTYLKQAAAAIDQDKSGPSSSSLEWSQTLPWPPAWYQSAKEMMQANGKVLELAHRARMCGEVDWGFRADIPTTKQLPSLNASRDLANVVCDAALYQHFNGDDSAAVETMLDDLGACDAVAKLPTLVASLVAIGQRAMAGNKLQILATGLSIENAAHSLNPAAVHPASRKQVEQLIHILLDEKHVREQFCDAIRGERVEMLDQLEQRAPFRMDVERQMALVDRIIEAAMQPRYVELTVDSKDDVLQIGKSFARTAQTLNRVMYGYRADAIGLAAALYYNDEGKYPATLSELVPKYLPAVPRDPLAKKEAPLWYMLAENGKRPIVWSVGDNGVAETTDETPLPAEANYSWRSSRPGENDDQWIDLSAWKP